MNLRGMNNRNFGLLFGILFTITRRLRKKHTILNLDVPSVAGIKIKITQM
jgi:hypothetical protein